MSLPVELPSSLLGTLVVFGIFALVAWAFLREAAKWVVRGLLLLAVVVFVAVWAGWLDRTAAGRIFQWVGDQLLVVVTAITGWLVRAWEGVAGGG